MSTEQLERSPRLMPALGRGVVTGIGKRPSADAPLPATRLVLPAARIEAARVLRYARVCGFQVAEPLPITYPHILGFPLAARLMGDRGFPLPLLGLVHTGIEITQHRPLSLTDRPELTVYAAGLRPHHRGTEAEIVTEARLGGELVWADRSSYLARHRTTDRAADGTTPDRTPDRATDGDPAGAAVPAADGSPDPTGAPNPPSPSPEPLPVAARWDLGADLGRRHAAVSGDWNPIHLYPLTARLFGFRRAIAHGMWTFARCAAETGASSARNVTVRAEFRAPVLLPGTVSYGRLGADFELRGGRDGSRQHLRGRVTTDGDG